MDYRKCLTEAGVPAELHNEAIASLESAVDRCKGLLWFKIKARLFNAKKLASNIPWEGERLIDYRPDLADCDIAPMINITGHGDNGNWQMTPQGSRPVPGQWLNKDPESDDYKKAVASNYWLKGTHPRSPESRIAWYKRNAGEFRAYAAGEEVNFQRDGEPKVYEKGKYRFVQSGKVWFLLVTTKLIGKLTWQTRIGYEIDNLWSYEAKTQSWYPIPGYALKAPATKSSIPRKK